MALADVVGEDCQPDAVSRAITDLLRVPPVEHGQDITDTTRAAWFASSAARLDALASAVAEPGLAGEAVYLARQARATAHAFLRSAIAAHHAAHTDQRGTHQIGGMS